MRGWFDAFRTDGGPTLYSYSNRTPVTGDPKIISICIVFLTFYIGYLLISPGIRKEKFTTFFYVTLSALVGGIISVCNVGDGWHVGDSKIFTIHSYFNQEKLASDIGVSVGLMHFNVTLKGLSTKNISDEFIIEVEDIDYNERVTLDDVHDEFKNSLGLPYPILTVIEYFNMDDEGFCWGRNYRLAGYYSSIMLWASFASWILMNLLLVMVPRYVAHMMCLTGGLMVTTNFLYYILIPEKPLLIRFEDKFLMFKFGWCFWAVLIAGAACCIIGALIATIDLIWPHKFSTILEVDYDTPYDRHIIIEESHHTKKKKSGKRSLEDPDQSKFGKKILRTLSKQEKVSGNLSFSNHLHRGLDNNGFEMDAPKSPWRYSNNNMMLDPDRAYPDHNQIFMKNPILQRLAAPTETKSPKSVSFRRQSKLEETFSGDTRIRRSDSKDSTNSSGSNSSGIGIHRENDELSTFQVHFKPPIERSDSHQSTTSLGSGSGEQIHTPLSRVHYSSRQGYLPRASLATREDPEGHISSASSSGSSTSGTSTSPSPRFYEKRTLKEDW